MQPDKVHRIVYREKNGFKDIIQAIQTDSWGCFPSSKILPHFGRLNERSDTDGFIPTELSSMTGKKNSKGIHDIPFQSETQKINQAAEGMIGPHRIIAIPSQASWPGSSSSVEKESSANGSRDD